MRLLSRLILILYVLTLAAGSFAQSEVEIDLEEPQSEVTLPATTAPAETQEERSTGGTRSDYVPSQRSSYSRPGDGGAQYSMSFDKADINNVIKFFSTISGVPIVTDPELRGNVTVICSKRISLAEAFEVINSALRVRGFTMVGGLDSTVIRVMPLRRAITDTSGVGSGKDLQATYADSDLVTQVVPLEYATSDRLRDELRPLVSSDQASLVSVSSSNTLIITDNAGNIRRLMEIIKGLDKDEFGLIEVEVYPCRYASAESLAKTLMSIFQPQRTATGVRGAPQPAPQPDRRRQPGAEAQPATGGTTNLRGEIQITSDARTNSLVISGTRDRINSVLKIAKDLDVDTEPEVRAKFFPLQYADARAVAAQLNALFEQPQTRTATVAAARGGAQPRNLSPADGAQSPTSEYAGLRKNMVVADVRTNSVIVTATEQNLRAFEIMIKDLDAPRVLSEVTTHYQLKYAKASELANTLNQLFRGGTGVAAGRGRAFTGFPLFGSTSADQALDASSPLAQLRDITVVAENNTNSLLVTGPPNSSALIRDLIQQLDRRTAQVFIEVAIVDVTLGKDTKFGVEWQWRDVVADGGRTVEHDVSTDFGLARETSGLKYSVLSGNFQALLHALKSQTNVKVLSTPTITTSDNVQARISIGQEQPFVSSETETIGGGFRRTVDFKKVAVALTVTPRVNVASDVIALDVHQTINELIGREPVLNAPIVADREAQTRITVRDGQTIVLGGIIKENKDQITRGVPLLMDIPLLGELFKTRENRTQKSELMVFLTPHILRDDEDVTAATSQIRERLSVQPPPRIMEAPDKD